MALKQINASENFKERLMKKNSKKGTDGETGAIPSGKTEGTVTEKGRGDLTADGLDKDALELALKAMKKKTRTMQRSIKLDAKVNQWLDNVKQYQKNELGIVRPCLDDLMYDAIVEYLARHYEELEP